jgi:hypothetical protein
MAREEKKLSPALLKAIEEQSYRLTSEEQAAFNKIMNRDWNFQSIQRGGSSNIPLLAAAAGLLTAEGPLLNKLFHWWHEYFDRSRTRFMEKEPFSRIYWSWMVVPVATVYSWAAANEKPGLANKAQSWLGAYWSYCALCAGWGPQAMEHGYTSDNRRFGLAIAMCGARSFSRSKVGRSRTGPPHHLEGNMMDSRFARAISWPANLRDKGWAWQAFRGLERRFNLDPYGLRAEHAQLLRDHVKHGNQQQAIVPLIEEHLPLTSFRFLRTRQGVASLMLHGINANTAPLYGATWRADNGHTGWLHVDPGNRSDIRMGIGWEGAGKLCASRTEPATQNHVLRPPGVLLYRVEVGPRGVEILTG